MAVNKKLIHFKQKDTFLSTVVDPTTPSSGSEDTGTAMYGQIYGTSIVFIKDSQQIWTHGKLYDCSNVDLSNYTTLSEVEQLLSEILSESKDYTNQTIEDLIGGAPEALDTLEELAAALDNNADIVDVLNSSITNKVDKISGKGLSTNDYTTAEKNKLAGIASGAEVNVQSDWNVTDTASDAYIKNKPALATVATSGSYNDLSNKPTIPSAVTETTVSSWGFTKNTGTYSKPNTGIPKTDLASVVQTSLDKADTALQSYTETDPVFSASAAAGIKTSDITNWNGKTSNTGTITGIKMNGVSKGTSGVVDLGTVITTHQDISGKQDIISDLATIRSGAALGATALQTVPSEYITESELEAKNYVASSDGTITNILKVTALPDSPDANTLYIIVEG